MLFIWRAPMTDPYGQPRILRAKHAPSYLGMCRAEFDKTVRPHVSEFPIGKQGVGFDRLELDAWADAYIAAHSIDKCTPSANALSSDSRAAVKNPQVTSQKSNPVGAPDSHAKSKEEFQRVLDLVRGKKRP